MPDCLRRRDVLLAWVAAATLSPVHAQRPLTTIVVGFGAGGTSDLAARAVAAPLRDATGGDVVVENRPGAGGRIALEHVRRAAPDGRIAALGPDAMMTLYPHVYRRLGYDPELDFVPVARLADLAIALYVGPMVDDAVVTLADYVRWVRADPRHAVFGTSAAGATPHFTGEMFARAAGVPMAAVHYQGGEPGIRDLAGGHLPAFFGAAPDGSAMRHAGRVRALATTGPQRSAAMPDVPTFAEQGYGDFGVEDGLGVYLPRGAASSLVDRLATALHDALENADVRRAFGSVGLTGRFEDPGTFARRLSAARLRWAEIVRVAGFKALD